MPTLRQVVALGGAAGGDLSGIYPNPSVAQASGAFALPGDLSPAAIGVDQNNYNPGGLSGASTLRLSSSAAVNLTGLQGGADGRLLTVLNVGANNLTLKDEDAASSAANRFALTADLVLAPDECCVLEYDATSSRWRAVGAARVPYGLAANTVCQGNDARLADARTPTGSAGGDLTGTYPNPTVAKLRGKNVPSPGASEDGKYLQYDNGSSACVWAAAGATGTVLNAICDGRLTLTSGTPVTTGDVTGAGTLYFTPYQGNRVALYDGAAWAIHALSQVSLSLTLTSGKNYDVFLYSNSGTLTLELSAAWTNDTTRADALVLQDGVYVKSGATTRRYLGTLRASGTNTVEDSVVKRFVWNAQHRLERPLRVTDATTSWTQHNTLTWRQANANSANEVAYVQGLAEDFVFARVIGTTLHSALLTAFVGVGVDSTSTNSAQLSSPSAAGAATAQLYIPQIAEYQGSPGIGYHRLVWLEYGNSVGQITWYSAGFYAQIAAGLPG